MLTEFFDAYHKMGLKIIPLYPCSKVPIGKGWNQDWDAERSRIIFERCPKSNMGMLLGEIVDVEADTDEANVLLTQLIGQYPHPSYTSSRSIHHLFVNPDPNLTIEKFDGIEFRANKHQSVLPPSHHEDGTPYKWVKGSVFPIPALPDSLFSFYKEKSGFMKKPFMKPDHIKPWCSVCKLRKLMHKKRYALEQEAFATLGYKWMCHQCREFDVRELCRKLRKKKPLGKSNQCSCVNPLI